MTKETIKLWAAEYQLRSQYLDNARKSGRPTEELREAEARVSLALRIWGKHLDEA